MSDYVQGLKQHLKQIVDQYGDGFMEARFHKRLSREYVVQAARLDTNHSSIVEGVSFRYRDPQTKKWGFASTANLDPLELKKTAEKALGCAKLLTSPSTAAPFEGIQLATDDVVDPHFNRLLAKGPGEKIDFLFQNEKALKASSTAVQFAKCRYKEIFEEKIIVTSDGAHCSLQLVQPEMSFSVLAEKNGSKASYYQGAGISGDWECLVNHPSLQKASEWTPKMAVDLLGAKYPDAGKSTVILSPALVGLLCHEAIGHTVEADFVQSGSVAQGKLGKRIASELVNLCDSGADPFFQEGDDAGWHATGTLPFDDEGVPCQKVQIIEKGILKNYLHDRESAANFGVAPSGNARAWLYADEPLIRMRNTYMEPGNQSLEEMVAGVKEGYLCEGAGGGQADSNGEFMFGCGHVWKIRDGKLQELLKDATLSGVAFDVLQTVDAVSKEFLWDLGTGYCGKGQPAKVDAGGPYVRCQLHVGGRSE